MIYVCLHTDGSASTSQVLNYVSKLYSKIWNEAALKNIFDIKCCVVGDSLVNRGIVSRNEILMFPDLSKVMTFDTADGENINKMRSAQNLPAVDCVDVNSAAQFLFDEFERQPSIICLDSHYEQQPRDIPFYDKVALGGTFDNMHYGHCKLLTLAALSCSQRLTVGITGDDMLASKSNAALISTYDVRETAVQTFLSSIKPSLELNLVRLAEPFGPTITDPEIEAIVVSSETIRGAFKINSIRVRNGMKPLAVLVTYRTDSVVLSSTFIREKKKL
jgi:phosphopantetheine adenylyltransferase